MTDTKYTHYEPTEEDEQAFKEACDARLIDWQVREMFAQWPWTYDCRDVHEVLRTVREEQPELKTVRELVRAIEERLQK
jgi:hypothetical protein